MNRIFFRILPLILLAIAVAAFAIFFTIRYAFGDPLEDIARRQAAGPIFLLEQYVDHAPADEWLTRLNKVREVSELSLDLLPLEEALRAVDPGRREALDKGEIVLDIGGKTFFRRVDLKGERYVGSDGDVLKASNLPIDLGFELKMEAIRYLVVAFCVMLPLGLWSRAHWRDLLSLSRVADEFGAGRLSMRAAASPRSGIHPLAACMNRMADRIESLLGSHKSLLHSVSHELRTPIARLEFGIELLKGASDKEKFDARLQAMEADVRELNTLVDELLNLTKLDQQQIWQASTVAMREMIEEAVAKTAHALADKQFRCLVAEDVGAVKGDRRLLERAVVNLLANASKYASHRIELSASKESDTIEIAVEDDGPGIPIEEQERVFEPFHRLDRSRDRQTGGFGLGLAIAQKAILLHHGKISISESPLGGARFLIRIPCSAQEG